MSKSVNFKFHPNWKRFQTWFDGYNKNHGQSPIWISQQDIIQSLFESTVPNIINWTQLWDDYVVWARNVFSEKGHISWGSQQRQIETLLLNQLKDLNQEQFVLVFKVNGKPQVDPTLMTYWEATRVKENLEGDSNGIGGDESMENITVVNLNKLLS